MVLFSGYHAYIFYLLTSITAASITQTTCLKELYGSPRPSDCEELLKSFADIYDDQPRLFDEEQLRTPDGLYFPGVKNDYPTSIVQLPAYWSLSQSLLSFLTLYARTSIMNTF